MNKEIDWFNNRDDFNNYFQPNFAQRRSNEIKISSLISSLGYCSYCKRDVTFKVSAGLYFSNYTNLREGMICEFCGLNNRLRLLYMGVENYSKKYAGFQNARIYIAEKMTHFYYKLSAKIPNLTGSEYLGASFKSGETKTANNIAVTHQDLCNTSFQDNSFDMVIHGDVLEHISDYKKALKEMSRITAPGGATIFTVPFLQQNFQHQVKASISPDGEIIHHDPPEIHGNPINSSGSFVFQNYGWLLLDEIRESGFKVAQIGGLADIALGFTSNNSPADNYMEPIMFMAQK
ncbi:MAG: class I SAM-dependent methyltransferase [Planctomycetota bacterium]